MKPPLLFRHLCSPASRSPVATWAACGDSPDGTGDPSSESETPPSTTDDGTPHRPGRREPAGQQRTGCHAPEQQRRSEQRRERGK